MQPRTETTVFPDGSSITYVRPPKKGVTIPVEREVCHISSPMTTLKGGLMLFVDGVRYVFGGTEHKTIKDTVNISFENVAYSYRLELVKGLYQWRRFGPRTIINKKIESVQWYYGRVRSVFDEA